MTWLLDTSVCVPLINRTDERAAARLLDHSRGSVRLCSVVKAELYFGAQYCPTPDGPSAPQSFPRFSRTRSESP